MLEGSVVGGVVKSELAEPLGCEPLPPPDGLGTLAEDEGCSIELLPVPPPPPRAVALMVLTTVTGEPGRGDSMGTEGTGAEPELEQESAVNFTLTQPVTSDLVGVV